MFTKVFRDLLQYVHADNGIAAEIRHESFEFLPSLWFADPTIRGTVGGLEASLHETRYS